MLYLEKSYHKTMSSTKPRLNFVCLRTESCLNFTSKLRNEPTSNKSNIVNLKKEKNYLSQYMF